MIHLGLDIGSSFVKAVLWDKDHDVVLARASWPERDIGMRSERPGWAEQDPSFWWDGVCSLSQTLLQQAGVSAADIGAVGISAQMHGLVLLDAHGEVVRPSILWCDSRAVAQGDELAAELSPATIEQHLFNHPGNFTISKLAWVIRHQPHLRKRIRWIMLPSDYIAFRMTGDITTTCCSLSEAMMWDFQDGCVNASIVRAAGADLGWIPPLVPSLGDQGRLSERGAAEMGLTTAVSLHFRAGDQPTNAFALGVEDVGDLALSAGTSGVAYRLTDRPSIDTTSATHLFAHVGSDIKSTKSGRLLCINGTGSAYSWLKRVMFPETDHLGMDHHASSVPVGSDGLRFLPFGNGAERLLQNSTLGAGWQGVAFNRHTPSHMVRSVFEGIACSFRYGLDRMHDSGDSAGRILAPNAGLFRSNEFCTILASFIGSKIEIHDTDGALGAAQGPDRPSHRSPIHIHPPDLSQRLDYADAYSKWVLTLEKSQK